RQQRDEHRDDYESERPDPDRAACRRHGAGGAARRGVDAGSAGATSSARSRGAGARGLARPVAAAFRRAEGRPATAAEPPGRSAADRAGIGGNTTAAATGPAAARDERAAAAVGDRHIGDADNAFGRGHAGHAIGGAWKRQAPDAAAASARSQTGDPATPATADHAAEGSTRKYRQARTVARAHAGGNGALGRGHAVDVNTGGRRACQTQNADANASRQAVDHDAFGRDHAGGAIIGAGSKRQARNAAATNAGCKAIHTDNAFSRDYAGHAIACKQAGNANASPRCKTSDPVTAADPGQAGHGLAFTAAPE